MRIKNYLSWSQYEVFTQSPEQYKKVYIDNIKRESKYYDFGHKIAEGIEHRNKRTKDNDVKLARKLLPKFQYVEKEFRVTFGNVPLLSKLDGFGESVVKNELVLNIEEVKTGKNEWNQSKVDRSKQITFYVMVVSQFYKVDPATIKIRLHYLETFEDTDYQMHLTGKYIVFNTQRTLSDVVKFYPSVKNAWVGIEELINSNLK